MLKNTSGMISAEFIFALTFCAGLCIVFFALAFTLSMSEVAQYFAFSVARAHSAGHIDPQMQRKMGLDKFNELMGVPVFKGLFNNPNGSSWFSLERPIIKDGFDSQNFSSEYPVELSSVAAPLTGVRILFKSKVLNFKIAFIGSTTENPDIGFTAQLTSFLFREPTQDECLEQVKIRNKNILNLSTGRYTKLGASTADKYVPLEDNGC